MSIQENNLKTIADAIRAKEGSSDPIKASTFPERIAAIQTGVDTSDATATADKILSGKTLYVKGEKVTGTLIPIEKPEWIIGTMPANTSWSSICYGAGKFVAVGPNVNPVYSTDGINWSTSNIKTNGPWSSVCYGAGKFIAVGRTGAITYSLDGINWTFDRLGPIMGKWNSVCYYDRGFEVIGQGGGDGDPAYSEDGINWEPDDLLFYADNWTLAYGNGTLVAVGDNSPEYGAIYSNNSTHYGFRKANLTKNKNWSSVCYGNGKFVAVAKDSNTAAYSEDGISWTLTEMPTSSGWGSVCYGNGKFIATSFSQGLFAYSIDGVNWISDTYQANQTKQVPVTYGAGKFVAVCNEFSYCLKDSFDSWA
ncbi:MAG: hypothetical protein ACLRVN_05360 [Butyricicoccus sp.]